MRVAKPRAAMSFNIDQIKSLDEVLAILIRGGDATVVARRGAVAEVLTLVRAARRRVESGLTLARDQRSMPGDSGGSKDQERSDQTERSEQDGFGVVNSREGTKSPTLTLVGASGKIERSCGKVHVGPTISVIGCDILSPLTQVDGEAV